MKNYAMPAAIAIVGFGLMSIGFSLNGNQANATPAAFNAGPVEPTIVWYDSQAIDVSSNSCNSAIINSPGFWLLRAWSDGTVEGRFVARSGGLAPDCNATGQPCSTSWVVISSPNEGLNAAADINFDERVDAADLGLLVAAWGDAPRNGFPPSDCPLGLIP
jgi:hypothetical protein